MELEYYYEIVLNKIREEYGTNAPILLEELVENGYDSDTVKQILFKAISEGVVKCYCEGVYFFPRETEFGSPTISPEEVADKKYVQRGGEMFGFYIGAALEQKIGISNQIPSTISIITNTVTSPRTIHIGYMDFSIEPGRIDITTENAAVSQMLEFIDRSDVAFLKENKFAVTNFFKGSGVSKEALHKYVVVYPDSVSRKLIEGGYSFDFA